MSYWHRDAFSGETLSQPLKPKLFIPGPTHVDDEILHAMGEYPVGHRSSAFSELYDEVVEGIKKVIFTQNRVFLGTCSATGLMEAAVRNTVERRCANFICGAFSKRWYEITRACGIHCDYFEVDPGRAIKPEMVHKLLETGRYDVLTIVHNETSTGVMNPIAEIAEIVNEFEDILLLVDMVSSMASVKVDVDNLGIDVALASVQKGWGLPPGFAVCSVSDRAFERSGRVKNKGYYFDFQVMERYALKSQTPTTPSLPHMYALRCQLNRIFREGLDNRFQRHKSMAKRVRAWAKKDFDLFAEKGFESDTVTCVENTMGINISDMLSRLLKKAYMISGGYGPLKGQTFRIAHMGDLQLSDIEELLSAIDETIEEMKA